MRKEFNREKTKDVAIGLSSILADSYTLYLMTQNFHWNVTGPRFHQLHTMFEEQYHELAEAVDDIAERIRAIGHRAPGSFKEFMEISSIDGSEKTEKTQDMLERLAESHELISSKAYEVIEMADSIKDEVTKDLLTGRMNIHEKSAWMLRSQLD